MLSSSYKNFAAAFLTAIICFATADAEENSWSTNGPQGGNIMAISFHPLNRNTVYIGSIGNGIYRSSNAGENWEHLPIGNLWPAIWVIQIHPFAPETMYASTSNGIFKSNDSGQSWLLLPIQRNPYEAFIMHPIHPNILFAGFTGGFKSTDSGETWMGLDLPLNTDLVRFAIDPVNTNNIYFVGGNMPNGNGIFKSTDLGESWFSIQNNLDTTGFGRDIAIDPIDPDILYFARSQSLQEANTCLSKSTNGGQSWEDITPVILTESIINIVRVSWSNHNVVFIATYKDGLLRSDDFGVTWQQKNMGLRTRWCKSIEIDSLTNNIYLGTPADGIYKSSDNGESWQPISENIYSSDCNDIAVDPQNPLKIYAAATNGLFQSQDGCQSWRYVDIGTAIAPALGAVTFDSYIQSNIYACSFNEKSLEISPGFWCSTDSGISWGFLNSGLPDYYGYVDIAISYLNHADRRIFLASHGGIFFSDNIGQTWIEATDGLYPNNPFSALHVAPGNPDILAAGDDFNRIFISTNRGESWRRAADPPLNLDGYILTLEFHPADANHLYISSLFSGIWESTDLGQSWQSLLNDLPIDPIYSQYPVTGGIAINPHNPSNIFVESNHMGIYQSHDGGLHWESFNSGLDTARAFGTHLYFFPDDTTRLIMPTSFNSVWSIHRTATGVEEEPLPLPQNISLSAYPNPFNSRTTLTVKGTMQAPISIYDVTGRKVGSLQAHEGQAVWEARGSASGLYFARAEGIPESQTIKLILLK